MKKKIERMLSVAMVGALVLQCSLFQGTLTTAAENQPVSIVLASANTEIMSGAVYEIESILSGKLLSVESSGNVYQWEDKKEDSQHWRIVASEDGYCKFVSMKDASKVLTVDNGDDTNGNNIYIDDDTDSDSQKFKIQKDGNSLYISTKCSSNTHAVDVYNISTENGANICQWEYWGGDGQKFKFTPVENTYTFIRGDLNYNGKLDVFDLNLMKRGLKNGFDDISMNVADITVDGVVDADDVKMLNSYLLSQIKSFTETYYTVPYIPEQIKPDGRKMEYLDRGVVAVSTGKEVFVSWRSLVTDMPDVGFNLYRTTDGTTVKLNNTPLYDGTNYTDDSADLSKNNTYYVTMIENGVENKTDGTYTLAANSIADCITVPINAGSRIHFVWVGDFNGDGVYDYLVDRYSDNHQQLEAYLNDGTHLWTINLGYNSENKNNISPGASTIDVGMWDGVTVYDIDCDGYAEVLLRIADGVTFGDGKVYSNNKHINAQAIAVIDGQTGSLKATAPVPDDYIEIGPMACMMEVGYLDGINPSIVCWLKNRNPNKSFNSLMVAYGYDENGDFKQQWKYDNKNYYGEAHQIRIADVDYDGKDEVLHMAYALNGDGSLRYHMDEVVHGDRWYVGSFCNENNGKEMMGYGIQQNNASGLLEYFYNASTGKVIWKNSTTDGSTYDVGRGNVGDIDPNYDGFECWSFQGTFNQSGKKITDSYMYPVIRLWWDGDLLSESYNDGKIEKWDYNYQSVNRLVTTWKVTDCTGSDRGAPMFYGDILGDWREEVIMTSSDYSKLVILTTTAPTDERIYCLAQNPCYRNCMTAKGYYQSHMLDYFLGANMDDPEIPNVEIIRGN